ncbi:penicillin-binding protein 2 [Candidatus Uhrbacteria bacterium]|nr:penicillin-binding protein 2 [Candidatus Uhrbacteria bacterium]
MPRPKPLPLLPQFDDTIAVRNIKKKDWVESSFAENGTGDNDFLGVSIQPQKITILFLIVCCTCTLFFIRSGYLQVVHGQVFAHLAEKNSVKIRVLPARRGVIYDRSRKLLTHNIPNFILQVVPSELPRNQEERSAIVRTLSELTKKSTDELEKIFHEGTGYQPVSVLDTIDYAASLQMHVAIAEMTGVSLLEAPQRRYNTADTHSLSHVLGYMGKVHKDDLVSGTDYRLTDTIGKEGIEVTYEKLLRGTSGEQEVEVDALGAEKGVLSEQKPIHGSDLVLTIDKDLQIKAEQALKNVLMKARKKAGVVIVTNPTNGDMLASVSLPSYDNNMFARGITPDEYKKLVSDTESPLFHRALSGEYPSGSTMKPIVASAGLQEKVISEKTRIMSNGGIRYGQWYFPDWKAGGHGWTTVTKALAESVNTFFYTIGGGTEQFQGLGVHRLISYFKKFGLGEKTGIDAQNEREGFVPTPDWKKEKKGESWYIGDTYHISIGQGDILVTPLQINTFTSYFANSGTNYVPHFISRILPPVGDEQKVDLRVYRKDIIERRVVDIVRNGMRAGVTTGSAKRLSLLGVSAAGKTGTAQWGVNKQPHAWFTGWAPFDNPQLALTVLVEEGEEGSRTAVPVAYEILQWYFARNAKP